MSKSVGIVAEYNPFHTGHRYQIDFLKEKGYENIIVAMSGSRVQRGTPALLNKHTRAKMAVENGVSLVAEIPYPFSSIRTILYKSSPSPLFKTCSSYTEEYIVGSSI